MMSLKIFIIWLSTMSGFNGLEIGTDEPKFTLEYNSNVSKWTVDVTPTLMANMPPLQLQHLKGLSPRQRIDLCTAAKKFAGVILDAPSPITDVPMRSFREEPVLQCPTMPVAYLRLTAPEEYSWEIILDANLFDVENKFEVRTEQSKPISCSESIQNGPLYIDVDAMKLRAFIQAKCFEDPLVTLSYLHSMPRKTDFLALCLAARLEISGRADLAPLLPSIRDEKIDPVQVYDFGGTKRVAFQCRSTPSMYIYFKAPRISKVDVQVVLVNDSESEPKTAPPTES